MYLHFQTPVGNGGAPDELMVKIGYVWTEGSSDELHIQFNGPSDDNYFVREDRAENYMVKFRGKVYKYKQMSFYAVPPRGVQRLDVDELKKFWSSPN